jgi:polar amino acid transport system substrate-binding protein
MRNTLKTLLLAGAAVGLVMGAAQAGTLDEIESRGQVVIGVKADYPPYGFIDPEGEIAGLEIDMARYLALRLAGSEHRLEMVPVVAANRIELLQQGRIDLVLATMGITEERARVIDFSRPYYASGTALLTRKDSGVSDWEELAGQTACGIQGALYNRPLEEDFGIQMLNFQGTAEAYQALQDGRCIGFAYDDSAIMVKLQEEGWGADFHQPMPVIQPVDWGIGIRQGDAEMKEAVDAIIQEMEASGFIVAAEIKWEITPTEVARDRHAMAREELGW